MRAAAALTVLLFGLGCSGVFDARTGPIWTGESPSGAYAGAVTEVDGPYGPVWGVSIEQRSTGFEWSARLPTPSSLTVYPAWDPSDRLWIYDSDVGATYRYDPPPDEATWAWSRVTDPPCDGVAPPKAALPEYARSRGWCPGPAALGEPPADDASEYAGTTWALTDFHPDDPIDHELTFLPGGRIDTQHPNDTTPRNDRWWPTDRGLTFSYNDDYATYELVRTGPDTLEGPAHNVTGMRWRVRLDRR